MGEARPQQRRTYVGTAKDVLTALKNATALWAGRGTNNLRPI
jgi:hypothetical protein